MAMKIKNVALGMLSVLIMGSAQANPITINFTGVQFSNPQPFGDAPNLLGISENQSVSGSFTVDIEGKAQINGTADNPNSAQYGNSVTAFSFNSISGNMSAIDYSYYFVDAENRNIQFYINDLYNGNSDVFELTLDIKPNVIIDDQFDLAMLKETDIAGFGNISTNSRWLWATTYNVFLSNRSTILYGGYLSSVSITPVSEPETDRMMMVGLGLLSVIGRHRKTA